MSDIRPRPFSIRIFLPDGTPDGVRVIEKSNWTGTGLVVPKSLFSRAKLRDEFSRTGVYVLVGHDDETDMPTIYIGQGDPVRPRLEHHFANKDFWTWVVFFVTRDDSLNKAHIGYLESELIKIAREIKRAKLDNQNLPQPSPLSEPDAADMDSFLADMLSILPLIGLTAFEKPRALVSRKPLLYLTGRGAEARGYESPQGFVVQAGSTTVLIEDASLLPSASALRKELIQQHVLARDGDFLRFSQDYVLSSSSRAASVVLGRAASGPGEWKDESGRSLREIHEADVALDETSQEPVE